MRCCTAEVIGPLRVVGLALGSLGDPRHRPHDVDRVDSDRRLARQHQGVGAVEHRVGDVADLGARRRRRRDHALHHLRRRDHRHAGVDAAPHDLLLHVRHVLERALDAEVAAGDHHRVGHGDDLVEVIDRRERLDLGDQAGRQRGDRVAHLGEIVGVTHERDREEVDALRRHRRGQHQVLGASAPGSAAAPTEGARRGGPGCGHRCAPDIRRRAVVIRSHAERDRAVADHDPVAAVKIRPASVS